MCSSTDRPGTESSSCRSSRRAACRARGRSAKFDLPCTPPTRRTGCTGRWSTPPTSSTARASRRCCAARRAPGGIVADPGSASSFSLVTASFARGSRIPPAARARWLGSIPERVARTRGARPGARAPGPHGAGATSELDSAAARSRRDCARWRRRGRRRRGLRAPGAALAARCSRRKPAPAFVVLRPRPSLGRSRRASSSPGEGLAAGCGCGPVPPVLRRARRAVVVSASSGRAPPLSSRESCAGRSRPLRPVELSQSRSARRCRHASLHLGDDRFSEGIVARTRPFALPRLARARLRPSRGGSLQRALRAGARSPPARLFAPLWVGARALPGATTWRRRRARRVDGASMITVAHLTPAMGNASP